MVRNEEEPNSLNEDVRFQKIWKINKSTWYPNEILLF